MSSITSSLLGARRGRGALCHLLTRRPRACLTWTRGSAPWATPPCRASSQACPPSTAGAARGFAPSPLLPPPTLPPPPPPPSPPVVRWLYWAPQAWPWTTPCTTSCPAARSRVWRRPRSARPPPRRPPSSPTLWPRQRGGERVERQEQHHGQHRPPHHLQHLP